MNETQMERLAERVRSFRTAHALTQVELAEKADLGVVVVIKAENRKPIAASTRRKLAAAMGVAPAALIAPGTDEMFSSPASM